MTTMKLTSLSSTKPNGGAIGKKYHDVTGTLRRILDEIKPGEAVKASEIVAALVAAEPTLPKPQGFVRLWHLEKRSWFQKKYMTAYDSEGGKYIGRREEEVAADEAEVDEPGLVTEDDEFTIER